MIRPHPIGLKEAKVRGRKLGAILPSYHLRHPRWVHIRTMFLMGLQARVDPPLRQTGRAERFAFKSVARCRSVRWAVDHRPTTTIRCRAGSCASRPVVHAPGTRPRFWCRQEARQPAPSAQTHQRVGRRECTRPLSRSWSARRSATRLSR